MGQKLLVQRIFGMGLCLIESMAKWVWVEPKKGRRARSLSACQGVELLAPPDPPETGGGGKFVNFCLEQTRAWLPGFTFLCLFLMDLIVFVLVNSTLSVRCSAW